MSMTNVKDYWASEGVWICGAIALGSTLLATAIEVPMLLPAEVVPVVSYGAKALTAIAGFFSLRLGSAISQSPNNSTGRI